MKTSSQSLDSFLFYITAVLLLFCANQSKSQSCSKEFAKYCFNGSAKDLSGNGFNGTISNAVRTSDRFSSSNSAYYFNGSNAKISVPVDSFKLNNYTYALWVYPQTNPGNLQATCILNIGGFGLDQMINIVNHSGLGLYGFALSTRDVNGTVGNKSVGSLPALNNWYHIAMTRTNSKAVLYVNGTAVDSTSLTGLNAGYASSSFFYIGARYNNSQYFHGKIDDVKIYRCALNASQISAVYQQNTCDTCSKYTVNPTISNLDSLYCTNASKDTLRAIPKGGSYSGPGLTDSIFSPKNLSAGNYAVFYTYTDSNSCVWKDTANTKVVVPAQASAGIYSSQCLNSPLLTLAGTPPGGVFSGVGVSSGKFNASTAGLGTHSVYYAATDSNNCATSDTTSVKVDSVPVVSFASLPPICSGSGSFALYGGSPTQGTYTGSGVSSGTFSPNSAGIGSHVITYTYTDLNACSASDTSVIVVSQRPSASISAIPPQCVSTFWINLAPYSSHSSGTFFGPTVFSNRFYPTIVGTGNHKVYLKVDSLGCSDTADIFIQVDTTFVISLSSYPSVCSTDPSFPVFGGLPAGGTYYVNGVPMVVINPASLGVGTHSVKYKFTNGCMSDSTTKNLIIRPQPIVTLTNPSPICSNAGLLSLSGGSPSGGSYFGSHISAGKFNPAAAGAGSHSINYRYTDGNGCSDTVSKIIVVDSVPLVSFTMIDSICANSDSITFSGGTPIGGIYKLNSNMASGFNPANQALGSHNIRYIFTDGKGCADSLQRILKLDSVTLVSYSSISNVCVNSNPVNINYGQPTGGRYYAAGVVNDSLFNPSLGALGINVIKYVLSNSHGCKDSVNQTIYVDSLPIVTFNMGGDSICINADSVLLTGSPIGGVLSGIGIRGNYFVPTLAGLGMKTILYTYTGGNGCVETKYDSIRVDSITNPTFLFLDSICQNSASTQLSGSPLGGHFRGNGVFGSAYQPNALSLGFDTVRYIYTNQFGCSDSTFQAVRVDTVPVLRLLSFGSICSSDSLNLNHGIPSGGIYSGMYVSGSVFNPKGTIGTHHIQYQFTDSHACTDSISDTVVVLQTPLVNISSLGVVCRNTPDFVLKVGSPSGGKYFGNGVVNDTLFRASMLVSDTTVLSYMFKSTNGCKDSIVHKVRIDSVVTPILGSFPILCKHQSDYLLKEGSPSGGIYSGVGVSNDSIFSPSTGYGSYQITYQFTSTKGCMDSVTKLLSVDSILKVDSLSTSNFCGNGDSIILKGGFPLGGKYFGTNVYFDSVLVSSSRLAGANTLYYSITNHCGSDTMSAPYLIYQIPEITFDSLPVLCSYDSSIVLNIAKPVGGTYLVNHTNSDRIDLRVPRNNKVNYILVSNEGCTGADSLMVEVYQTPNPTISGKTTICSTDTLRLQSEETFKYYYWNSDTANNRYVIIPPKLPYGTKSFDLKVVDSSGCSGSVTTDVTVSNCGKPFRLWPNPNNGQFNIVILSQSEKEVDLEITGSLGQAIRKRTLELKAGSNYYNVFMDDGAGVYVVKITLDGETFIEKFIIK
ncbi:MAG: T9SS type A sorting domain-containing protein [Flavobacteriales bacterium]|nr:T9SS type A sorting domain-containing protein [Flavobacteriales bacterium]